MCFLLRSFIAMRPFAARALRTGSSPIFSRGSCLTRGRHPDRTRSDNVQLTHTACTNTSGAEFLFDFFVKRLPNTAGFGACIPYSGLAKSLAARETAFAS